MIGIQTPDYSLNEIKYIINILFSEFLGIDYKIIIDNTKNHLLRPDNKILNMDDDLEYLKKEKST